MTDLPCQLGDLIQQPFSYWPNALTTRLPAAPLTYIYKYKFPQEVGGTLIGKDGLVVMAGAESVEWYQIHGFHVFDAIPFAPFHTLL
jgi:hypothetical protein